MQTFRKLLSVRPNVLCERRSPAQLSAAFENVRETRLAARDGRLLLKSPSAACKTKEADLVTAIAPATLLWLCPTNAAVSSTCGHQCNKARGHPRRRAGAGTPSLAYTPSSNTRQARGCSSVHWRGWAHAFGGIRTVSPCSQKPVNTHLNLSTTYARVGHYAPFHTLFWVTKVFQIWVFKPTFFACRKKPICP